MSKRSKKALQICPMEKQLNASELLFVSSNERFSDVQKANLRAMDGNIGVRRKAMHALAELPY